MPVSWDEEQPSSRGEVDDDSEKDPLDDAAPSDRGEGEGDEIYNIFVDSVEVATIAVSRRPVVLDIAAGETISGLRTKIQNKQASLRTSSAFFTSKRFLLMTGCSSATPRARRAVSSALWLVLAAEANEGGEAFKMTSAQR